MRSAISSLHAGYLFMFFFMFWCCLRTFFFKIILNKFFEWALRNSNGLHLDQDRLSVGPDLGSNCLQRLSADNKVASCKERVKTQGLVIGQLNGNFVSIQIRHEFMHLHFSL